LEFNLQAALNKKDLYEKYYRLIAASTQTVDRLNAMKNKLEIIGQQLKPGEPYDSLRKEIDKVRDTVQYHLYLFLPNRDIQGIASNPQLINYKLNLLGGYLNSLEGEPTASHHLLYEQTREAVRSVIGKVNDWTDTGWKSFEEWVENTRLELFEDYEPIKIE
jgi:hypothetical protein